MLVVKLGDGVDEEDAGRNAVGDAAHRRTTVSQREMIETDLMLTSPDTLRCQDIS